MAPPASISAKTSFQTQAGTRNTSTPRQMDEEYGRTGVSVSNRLTQTQGDVPREQASGKGENRLAPDG